MMPAGPEFVGSKPPEVALSRRRFVRGIARASVAFAGWSGGRRIARAAPAPPSGIPASTDTTEDTLYVSATRIAELIRGRKISSVEAVRACIARIEAVNPAINAVVMTCFDRALAEAKAADDALARGQTLGVLHGVPMTIKDSLDTAGVVTTGGTLGRIRYVPKQDATAVARVRKAGAILLGKTLTPEFTLANLPGISSASNLLNGLVRNPYNLEHNASASSGGAGAIVAAGGSYFDIGSDFGGSIRGPAHVNGIAGLKPTTGRVPRTGHIIGYGGVYDSYQQIGPLARRAEDLNLILRVIAGPDFRDAAIVPAPLMDPGRVEVAKLRVAYYYSAPIGDSTGDTKAVIKRAVDALAAAGARTREDIHPYYQEAIDLRAAFRAAEGNSTIRRLADKWGTKTLAGQYNFTPNGVTAAGFVEMLERQDRYRSAMLSWFKDYDVIVCPDAVSPATLLHDVGPANLYYNSIYNITGWPAGVVRGGTSEVGGLPIGVHIIAPPFREDVVLATAAFLERQLGGYQRPPI